MLCTTVIKTSDTIRTHETYRQITQEQLDADDAVSVSPVSQY